MELNREKWNKKNGKEFGKYNSKRFLLLKLDNLNYRIINY